MDLTRRRIRALFLVGVVLGLFVSGAAIGAHLSDTYVVTGPVAYNASATGPTVNVTQDTNVSSGNPFPNGSAFALVSEAGNVTFESSVKTRADLDVAGGNGDWTNLSDMDVDSGELIIDPEDKARIGFENNTDAVNITDLTVDDGNVDFIYSSSGPSNISLYNLNDRTGYTLVDADTDSTLGFDISNDDGVATFEDADTGTHSVEVQESPANMRVFNETAPETLIDDRTVTAEFFDLTGDEIFTETTSNGTISLENLTVSTFAVRLSTTDYADRQVIIKDINQQQDVWMLNESSGSITTVSPTFSINDETGDFDPFSTRVFIQRGLTIGGETTYQTIGAEEVGTDGYTETIEADQRYRIIVENTDGDRRVLGKFSASDSGNYVLTVEQLTFNLESDDDVVEWDISYINNTGATNQVRFNFTDNATQTTELEVIIFERGNESNEIHNQTYAGPLGEISITEDVTDNDSAWGVEWTAERDTTLTALRYVGPRGLLDVPLPDTWKHVIAVGLILIIGGLASQVNSVAVSIAVAGFGAMLWYIGWLPTAVAGGMIILAFAIPAMYLATRPTGGTI